MTDAPAPDESASGYERIAAQYLAARGRSTTGIGVAEVRAWAQTLPQGAVVLELGCGSGLPLTRVLLEEGLAVHGVDASPTLVAAFRANCPGVRVVCEAVEDSPYFDRRFDAVLAWGLWFLLPAAVQQALPGRVAGVLVPGGRLLFTAPAEAGTWRDVLTGLESCSLGAAEYRRILEAAGFWAVREYEDAGQNHYYEATMAPPPVTKET